MKKNQGITLISLVVTIIILLILAGVTLALIGGNEGILGKATNAVDKHEIAMIKETVELKIAEDIEKFHEEKYVDFSIDNSMTAYEYLKKNTDKTIQKGDEEYTITYIDSSDSSKPDDNKIEVKYVKKGTKLKITGKISQTGVITWDEDVEISGGNTGVGGTGDSGEAGDSGETEKDIPLSISEPTWNGTNATVTVMGKKKGSTLQYKIGDDGEWKDIESGGNVTVPAGTKVEICFFDGTEREVISSPKVLTLSYTIAYDGNGATEGSTASSSHEYGTAKALNPNGFVKEGYTFKGWNTTIEGTGNAYADGESVTNLSSTNGATVTLFAQWEDVKSATKVISATNYGDEVNYSANGVEDWKIFLNDGTHIYIIASDYVPNSGMTIISGISKNGSYKVYGPKNSVLLLSWLATESNWSQYAEGIAGATAIGGSTKLQIAQSYNQKYGTAISMELDSSATATLHANDQLYVIKSTAKASNCWIVSECTYNVGWLWRVTWGGSLAYGNPNATSSGVRPVVCLPEGVKGIKGEDGKWTFSM